MGIVVAHLSFFLYKGGGTVQQYGTSDGQIEPVSRTIRGIKHRSYGSQWSFAEIILAF